MPGDQHGLQRGALGVVSSRDHGYRRDRRKLQLLEAPEKLVLTLRHAPGDLLHGVDVIADMDEAHDVT